MLRIARVARPTGGSSTGFLVWTVGGQLGLGVRRLYDALGGTASGYRPSLAAGDERDEIQSCSDFQERQGIWILSWRVRKRHAFCRFPKPDRLGREFSG